MSTTKDLSDIFTENMGLWYKIAREELNDKDYAEDLVNDVYLDLAETHTEVKEYNKEYIVKRIRSRAADENKKASNRSEYTNHRELEGDGFDATAHVEDVVNNPAADWLAPDEQDPDKIYLANNIIEDAFKGKVVTKQEANVLNGVIKWGFTQQEVADKLEISNQRVNQLQQSAIGKVREHYGADFV